MNPSVYDPRPDPSATTPAPPPMPTAPPTVPGALGRAPSNPVWPVALGIVSVVFGSFGLLQNLWGFAALHMMDWFSGFMPQGGPNPMAAMINWRIPLSITYTFASIASLLLLIGGVLLLMRRYAASPGLICWALLKIPVTLALTILTILMQMEQFETMAASTGGPGVAFTGFTTPLMIVSGVIGVLWGIALPVFVLIWFTRKNVRALFDEWRNERAGLALRGAR